MSKRIGGNITENTTFTMTCSPQQESIRISSITSGNHKTPLWGTSRYCPDWIKGGRHDPSDSDNQRMLKLIRLCPGISLREICSIMHIDKKYDSREKEVNWIKALAREQDKMGLFSLASSV
jgi:hypothetical protein